MERFEVLPEYLPYLDDWTVDTLEHWFNYGGNLSGFYSHLLSGDYESAACNASGKNLDNLGHLVRLLAQSAPDDGFGSPEKVNTYIGLMLRLS